MIANQKNEMIANQKNEFTILIRSESIVNRLFYWDVSYLLYFRIFWYLRLRRSQAENVYLNIKEVDTNESIVVEGKKEQENIIFDIELERNKKY